VKIAPRLAIAKFDFNTLVALFLSILIVFLQAGFSYYLSVQTLALVLVVVLILISKPSLIKNKHLLLIFLLLPLFIGITASSLPIAISRNSSNIIVTVTGILMHAFFIICLPNLRLNRVRLVLFIFKYASASTVVLLACLIVLTDSPLFPFLNRELLLLQNSSLVTNFSNQDVLINELAYRAMYDLLPRLDLFYGEASYLAIVIFVCVVCFMLTSRLISDFYFHNDSQEFSSKSSSSSKHYKYVVIVGIMSLLYVQSLSSIIYALLISFYATRSQISNLLTPSKLFIFIVFVIIFASVFVDSFEYVLYRVLTMQDSLSASQRFGSLLDFGINDYLFGLSDASRMPKEGFHNSLFHIIAISGVAGIYYLIYLLRTVYLLAKPVEMSLLLVLLILALIMQNGAVFSPNKVVLLSLILLPLSFCRGIYIRKSLNFAQGGT